jgi:peptide-methionine (S)-S-oxide reductase
MFSNSAAMGKQRLNKRNFTGEVSPSTQKKWLRTLQAQSSNMASEMATFGTGCFWCTEAIYKELKGVSSVMPGYAGGQSQNPTYQEVCSGNTGHAECTQLEFDPGQISYEELLEVFFKVHDPTQLNRQGNDVGTQYRSVIFYHNDEQKRLAEKYKTELDRSGAWDKPIVTQIAPLEKFYPAENYHHDYYTYNKDKNPYCSVVIRPKLDKFRKIFADKLKD